MKRRKSVNREKVDKILKDVKERREKKKKEKSSPAFPAFSPMISHFIKLGNIKFSDKEVISMSTINCRKIHVNSWSKEIGMQPLITYDDLEVQVLISSKKFMRLLKLIKNPKVISLEAQVKMMDSITHIYADGKLVSVSNGFFDNLESNTKMKVVLTFQPHIFSID